jgi:hypothetical protein
MPRSNDDARRQVEVLPERIGAVRLSLIHSPVNEEIELMSRSPDQSSRAITPERTILGIWRSLRRYG